MAAAGDGSQYAQALARGLRYLRAASDYFTGRADDAALHEQLNIGDPEW